ncbi:MAG: hypothetical protein SOW25_00045 [Helicobacter sp.]|nr:hypothetical protein [Helicobacter sp.]
MISGIDSGSIAASGNLSVLKKAMDSEERMMNSIINGMQGASGMQTQAPAPAQQPSQSTPSVQGTNKLDIMA